jgi:hypothetical protein
MEAETFEFALPRLSAVRDKWIRLLGGKIPSQEPQILEFLTDVFQCYGKKIFGFRIKEPYYMTSDIWSSSRIALNVSDQEGFLTTIEIEYSERSITFQSDSRAIHSTLGFAEDALSIFEETGEYETSDEYQEIIMWGLDPNPNPTITVTIRNITGAYREFGQLATLGSSHTVEVEKQLRADMILDIHRSGALEDASRLVYDILRDIPLAEEDRRIIYACILEIILANTRSPARKKHLREVLSGLRDNHRGPSNFIELFNTVDAEPSRFLHLSNVSTPFHGEQSTLPDLLLDALITCAELDWNITVESYGSFFPWRSRPRTEHSPADELSRTTDVILDPVCSEGVSLAHAYFTALTSCEQVTAPAVVGFCAQSWQSTMTQVLLNIVDLICRVAEPGARSIQVTDPRTAPWSTSLPEASSEVLVVSDSRETVWLRAGNGIDPDETAADTLDSRLSELSRIVPVTVDIT